MRTASAAGDASRPAWQRRERAPDRAPPPSPSVLSRGDVVAQPPRQAAIEQLELGDPIDELVLRTAEERVCAGRMQPRSDHPREAAGPHPDGARRLTGEQDALLRTPAAAGVRFFERVAAMHDDLGAAVWRNRLGADELGGPFEPPQAIDETAQRAATGRNSR